MKPELLTACAGGIVFTGESVRAIREGRKARTTRLLKPQPKAVLSGVGQVQVPEMPAVLLKLCPEILPRYRPGKHYYVKEVWGDADHYYQGHANDCPSVVAYKTGEAIQFNAEPPMAVGAEDMKSWNWDKMKWRSPMFMPRWAARYVIAIVDATVMRLQEITNHLAVQEAVTCWICNGRTDGTSEADCECFHSTGNARDSFAIAWDAINGKRATWESNPWVWSYSFKLVTP